MWPPSASAVTSQCCAMVIDAPPAKGASPLAYSKARRINRVSCTPVPSSVNIRTPSPTSSAMGDNDSPRRPTVIAADGNTSQQTSRASAMTSRTTDALSIGGIGVGHGHHRGETTQRGATRARFDGLGLFFAGLAQMRVQVDETRADEASRRVERAVALEISADFEDGAVGADEHIGAARPTGVDHGAPAYGQRCTAVHLCSPFERMSSGTVASP